MIFNKQTNKQIDKQTGKIAILKGFTLAEVLIAIGIIGVVAAVTIPSLISNLTERALNRHSEVFLLKLNESLKQMNLAQKASGFSTNQQFLDEFKNYIKLSKTCDVSSLSNCIETSVKSTNGSFNIDMSGYTKGSDFASSSYTAPLVGAVTLDGVSMMIAYNPNCPYYSPYESNSSPIACLSAVYDINGKAKPNRLGKDVHTLNANIELLKIGGLKVALDDIEFGPISYDSEEFAKVKSMMKSPASYTNDYWAGALYECYKQGMRLPTYEELRAINAYITTNSGWASRPLDVATYGLNFKPGSYWADDWGYPPNARRVYVLYGPNNAIYGASDKTTSTMKARCVK